MRPGRSLTPPIRRLVAQEESTGRWCHPFWPSSTSPTPPLHHADARQQPCHVRSRARWNGVRLLPKPPWYHRAHWRTFCRSSSGVMAERNWGTCGKTQLCVSDEWLGLLSLTCPPSSITPPSPTRRLFKRDPNARVLFFGVVCRSQWGVSITNQWGQWCAQFSLFTSLLLFASPRPTKKEKEKAHMYISRCGREPTWSICYKHAVSRSFSPLQLQQAELWRHALCFGSVESRGLVALLSCRTCCLRLWQGHGQY